MTAAIPRQPRYIALGLFSLLVFGCFVVFTPYHSDRHVDVSYAGGPPVGAGSGSLSSSTLPTSSWGISERPYGKEYTGHSHPVDINRVTNDTLGFTKVFAVGLPERSDRRDAITLTGSLTGFHVKWVDSTKGENIPDEAVPFGADRQKLWESRLGTWRGHMNAIRRIVDEDLDSALIIEDDVDWDVRLKPQLERIAQGTRALLGDKKQPNSPYGDDWDLLWLGHCGEVFPETLDENKEKPANDPSVAYMRRKFVIENDMTVPPRDRLTGFLDFNHSPDHTRWVHMTGAPICSFAYALSQRGARKVLLDMSVDRLSDAFDNAMAGLCRRALSTKMESDPAKAGDRGLGMNCISVTPPIFFRHKAKNAKTGDSEMKTSNEPQQTREKGRTENIMWSARNNIKNMLMGTQMESQY